MWKRKKEEEVIEASTIDTNPTEQKAQPKEAELTPEQKKIKEMLMENLEYFEKRYGQIDFGENSPIKQLLFGIFCEIRDLNDEK